MKRNQRKVLLAYSLDTMELAKLELMGHKVIAVTNLNGGALIRDLLDNKGKPTSKELPAEKVIIFNGYRDEDLKAGVIAIRTNFKVKPIIAAVTDNSYEWPFEFLLTEHLIKDRDWNLKNAKEYRENLLLENQAEAERAAKEAEAKAKTEAELKGE